MKEDSRYQAAEIVSQIVADRFNQHLLLAAERGEKNLVPAPESSVIRKVIDSAFWASLRKEEGHSPRISLVLLPPEQVSRPLLFDQRMPLSPSVLTKLSPGLERPGVHLGIWSEEGEIYIWGTTLDIPYYCFVLDVSDPALLVIKHRRLHGFGKFANVAVLAGDQVKMVDEQSGYLPDTPSLLRSLLGYPEDEALNVLIYLSVSMRAHKHGGTLLIVPSSGEWKESIIHPMKYTLSPAYSGIKELVHKTEEERGQAEWKSAIRKELDSIAGLTAIDGATIVNKDYELLAFGAKIASAGNGERVKQICSYEPIVGGEAQIVNPSHSGGTRHLSAAQFIYDQRDAMAMVASQDGHFTIFTWSQEKGMVQAHRIDTLLL
ncbi:MAG: putative sensor domain DACNV-containing protein [Cytophagaceae bacterium]